ncbi:MAG: hypothetical protein WBC51_07330 [Vicinamibacterales bacterium]
MSRIRRDRGVLPLPLRGFATAVLSPNLANGIGSGTETTRSRSTAKGTWLRSPHQSAHHRFTGPDGALIYVKTGHLAA